jgi:hypothetical protein
VCGGGNRGKNPKAEIPINQSTGRRRAPGERCCSWSRSVEISGGGNVCQDYDYDYDYDCDGGRRWAAGQGRQSLGRSAKVGESEITITITITILRAIYLQGAKHPCQRDIIDIYWCFVDFYPCQHPCQWRDVTVTKDEGPLTMDRGLRTIDHGRRP